MKKWQIHLLWLALLLVGGGTAAARPGLGELQTGEFALSPITNHQPWGFANYDAYWNSLQKVDLEIGGLDQFKDLPQLAMKEPYTGNLVLGDSGRKFGLIIDIVGEEKRLYIDSDGDGSFAGEGWTPLLNEWQGLQIYWVYGPEPVRVNVPYQGMAGSRPLELEMSGLLNKPGVLVKEKPFLRVSVRTWFLGRVVEDGAEKLVAVVDRNHNGRFNDPEDLLFLDFNDDGAFDREEALPRKRGLTVTAAKRRLDLTWGVYPEKLGIGGKAK